jgi:hypothetical protein
MATTLTHGHRIHNPPLSSTGGPILIAVGGRSLAEDAMYDEVTLRLLMTIDLAIDEASLAPAESSTNRKGWAFDAKSGRSVYVSWDQKVHRRHLRRVAFAVSQVATAGNLALPPRGNCGITTATGKWPPRHRRIWCKAAVRVLRRADRRTESEQS